MDPEHDSATSADWLRLPDDAAGPGRVPGRQPPSRRAAAAVALAGVGMAAGAIFVAAAGHAPAGPLRPAVTTVTGAGTTSPASHGDDGGYADDGGRSATSGD